MSSNHHNQGVVVCPIFIHLQNPCISCNDRTPCGKATFLLFYMQEQMHLFTMTISIDCKRYLHWSTNLYSYTSSFFILLANDITIFYHCFLLLFQFLTWKYSHLWFSFFLANSICFPFSHYFFEKNSTKPLWYYMAKSVYPINYLNAPQLSN